MLIRRFCVNLKIYCNATWFISTPLTFKEHYATINCEKTTSRVEGIQIDKKMKKSREHKFFTREPRAKNSFLLTRSRLIVVYDQIAVDIFATFNFVSFSTSKTLLSLSEWNFVSLNLLDSSMSRDCPLTSIEIDFSLKKCPREDEDSAIAWCIKTVHICITRWDNSAALCEF